MKQDRTSRTTHTRPGIPAAGLALGYFALAVIPLLLAMLAGGPSAFRIEAASALGMVATVLLLLQFVSSGRFEFLSGRIGIDITMAFHKWMARLLVALVILHVLVLTLPADASRPHWFPNHIERLFTSSRNQTGVYAFIVILLLVGLGLLRDRIPVTYEAWRASHGVMALLAAIATLHHLLTVGAYSRTDMLGGWWIVLALVTFALALGVYTVRVWQMLRQDWIVKNRRKLADRLWEITLESPSGRRLDFEAGQFAWLALAPRRFPLFDHPFSIASSPAEGQVRFLIQEVGDFTGRLATLPIGARAAIDGPHGSFVLTGRPCEAIVLIAGGVGLAPILSMLNDLAESGETRPVRLVYAARDAEAMVDREHLAPALDRLGARAMFLLDKPPFGEGRRAGPVTPEHLAEALQGLDVEATAVMVCGPAGMMSGVCRGLTGLGVPTANIHYERFDYRGGPSTAKDRAIIRNFRLLAAAIGVAMVAFVLRG